MTAERAAFLEKAHRSLEAARLWYSPGQSQFAAARAYYAMFYAAKALPEAEGLTFSKHASLISAYSCARLRVQAQ